MCTTVNVMNEAVIGFLKGSIIFISHLKMCCLLLTHSPPSFFLIYLVIIHQKPLYFSEIFELLQS